MPHWKKMFNPDYLGAWALEKGQEPILTIKSVKSELVTGDRGRKEELLVARFEEESQPMILNKTNCKTIQKIYKTPNTEDWVGKKIQVYATTTPFGGEVVECLRIKECVPVIEPIINCEDCGENIKPAHGMTAMQFSQYTLKKTGAKLCADCAAKRAKALKEKAAQTEIKNVESEDNVNENNENKD